MTAAASRALGWLDRFPYAVLAAVLRLAVAEVFWSSGQSKLLSWSTTVALFKQEYRVPLLPPELAAYLAATIELTTPVLLVLGLLVRGAPRHDGSHRDLRLSPGRSTCNGPRCCWSC